MARRALALSLLALSLPVAAACGELGGDDGLDLATCDEPLAAGAPSPDAPRLSHPTQDHLGPSGEGCRWGDGTCAEGGVLCGFCFFQEDPQGDVLAEDEAGDDVFLLERSGGLVSAVEVYLRTEDATCFSGCFPRVGAAEDEVDAQVVLADAAGNLSAPLCLWGTVF